MKKKINGFLMRGLKTVSNHLSGEQFLKNELRRLLLKVCKIGF